MNDSNEFDTFFFPKLFYIAALINRCDIILDMN